MESDDMFKLNVRPCVGCGYCCMKVKCSAGSRLYHTENPCPALIWSESDKRYICNLMTLPGKIGEGYKEELAEGAGCCSGLNSWRKDVKKRDPEKNFLTINIDPLFQTFLKTIGKGMISDTKIKLILCSFENELKIKGTPIDEVKEISKEIVHHIENNQIQG